MRDRNTPFRPFSRAVLATLAASLLVGCTTFPPTPLDLMTAAKLPPGYDGDAEHVFRYQSRIADAALDRLALREIDDAGVADPLLAAADARMTEMCRYLNEAAVSRAEGREPPWDLRLKVFATTKPCAQAAQEVALLLRGNPSSLATAKL